MRYYIFLFLFICCNSPNKNDLKHNTTSIIKANDFYSIVNASFSKIDTLVSRNVYDSLDVINDQLVDTLVKYKKTIFTLPDTLGGNLFVVKSVDSQVVFVSWDSRMGGTWLDFVSLMFYRFNGEIRYKKIIDSNMSNTSICVVNLFQLQTDKKKYYISRGFGQGSTRLPWELISAYSIVGDSVHEEKILPEFDYRDSSYPTTLSDQNFTSRFLKEFDRAYCEDKGPCPASRFSDDLKTIKIPKSNKLGGHTNKFYTLKFDGSQYRWIR